MRPRSCANSFDWYIAGPRNRATTVKIRCRLAKKTGSFSTRRALWPSRRETREGGVQLFGGRHLHPLQGDTQGASGFAELGHDRTGEWMVRLSRAEHCDALDRGERVLEKLQILRGQLPGRRARIR
jgi:hypothetical protein